MDLLLISRCPPFPLYHGDRLIPYHLARELSARHYQIDLLAFYQQPEDLAEVPRYERLFRSVTLIREPERTRRDYSRRMRRRDSRFPATAEASWSPEMWNAIDNALQERSYQIAHLFGGVNVYEYLNLVRAMPNVIVPYESYSLWLERAVQAQKGVIARAFKRLQRRAASNYESWMFDQFDRTVVLTEHDARSLKALNPRTATIVIPNGVDIDFFTPTGFEPEEPGVMFIGNYDYQPNLDAARRLVRDIFPKVIQAVPKARLYIVGGNPPPELRAYASESIEITGRVPDIRSYFELSMVFLSPLRLGAGIKNKVLEAMAMGVPVVATPLSCDGIPVTHGQHVMLGSTNDELIDSVFRLFKDARLRRQIRINGRRLIEQQFTWQRVANQYEDLYRRVIQERTERERAGLA